MRKDILIKTLVMGVVFLFIGAGIVSSTEYKVEDTHPNYKSKNFIDVSKELLSRGNIAYSYIAYAGGSGHPEGPCYFDLDDPGTLTSFGILNCPELCGATWTNYGKMLVLDETGALWEINLCNRTASKIGGGSVSLSLSYNPVNDKLYGVSSSGLYEINISTGEQTYIGSFGLPGKTIIAIAINIEGRAFIWDILFSGTSTLWEVDLETGEASEVGSMGEPLVYVQGGAFDWETGILWLAAYYSYGFLATCDIETGELTHMGNFEGGAELCGLVIPDTDDFCPPNTIISYDPPEPDGCNGWYVSEVNVTLNASDDISGVKIIYYKIPGDDWNSHSGDSIKILLNHECLTGLIEFYSIDNVGNQEEIKSVYIYIDQSPPHIQLSYEIMGGNPIQGWDIVVIANVTDYCSGMDRVEFYLNGGLQTVVTGPGPIYSWSFKYYADMNNITVGVNCCDIACNCAYYEKPIKSGCNNIQLLTHPLFILLLERLLVLQRLLDFI